MQLQQKVFSCTLFCKRLYVLGQADLDSESARGSKVFWRFSRALAAGKTVSLDRVAELAAIEVKELSH